MSQGKYQIRKTTHGWVVYSIIDNEAVARFKTELDAKRYANKLNGGE